MRNHQSRLTDFQVIVEQNVQVNRAWPVGEACCPVATKLLLDGQQLGKPAQILAAIVVFAILGKTTDWLIEIGFAPLLRWQDAFGKQDGTN